MNAVERVAKFETTGFSPVGRPDIPPFPMQIPFDWGSDPYNDMNWRFQLQTLRYLMVYISAFKETGEKEHLLTLMAWFEDWWKSARKDPNSHAWHDMATGIRAEKIHLLASQLKLSSIKIPVWFREMIIEHVRVIRTKGFVRLNHNHGLYVVHGLRCLAEHLGPGLKASVISSCDVFFESLVKNQFDENYVHREHSPHYHHLVLKSLVEYKKTGLYDHLKFLNDYIEGAQRVSEYFYLPDGREVPFGDTDNKERGKSLYSDAEVFWCKSGYAIYRNGESYLCVTNNYNGRVHKHWDNLSIIYGVAGFDVLVDPGKYKYSSDSIRKKIVSSSSHNTIGYEGGEWAGEELKKDSLFLVGEGGGGGAHVRGGLQLAISGVDVFFNRDIKLFSDKLVLVDSLILQDQTMSEKIYSRFTFHKNLQVLSCSEDEIVLFFEEVRVFIRFNSVGGGRVLYSIETVPVSYRHGSVDGSLSIKIYNSSELLVQIEVVGGAS